MKSSPLSALRAVWVIVALGLALYSALTVWLGIAGMLYPYQLDYGEGNMLWFAGQFALGQPVYKPLYTLPLVSNNYPPVPMMLAAPFYLLLGPSYAPGRLLNLAAVLVCAALLYAIAERETHARRWGLLAAGLFLSSTFIYHWAPLYRVDLIGLAFSLGGIYLMWRWEREDFTRARLAGYALPALILFVLAWYSKPSLLAAPAAACLALFLRDRRLAVGFGAAFAAALGAILALGNFLSGGGFWQNLITANAVDYLPGLFAQILWMWLREHAVVILLALVLLAIRVRANRRLTVLDWYCLGAIASGALAGRVGAWENYFFEAIAMTSLYAALFFALVRLESYRALAAVALLAQLVLFWPDHDPRTALQLMDEQRATAPLAAVLAQTTGPIISEQMGPLMLAGKPVIYFPFLYSNLARSGMWDQHWELDNLRAGAFPLIVLDRGTREDVDRYRRFTHQFLSQLDASYSRVESIGPFELYRPAPLAHTAQVDFGTFALMGWSREPVQVDASTRTMTVTLLWRANEPPRARFTAFVHLEDERGGVVAQQDVEPHSGAFPTTNWAAGDQVREQYRLELKAPLAPGKYALRVGWYDTASHDRLATGEQDFATIDEFEIK